GSLELGQARYDVGDVGQRGAVAPIAGAAGVVARIDARHVLPTGGDVGAEAVQTEQGESPGAMGRVLRVDDGEDVAEPVTAQVGDRQQPVGGRVAVRFGDDQAGSFPVRTERLDRDLRDRPVDVDGD